MGGKMMSSPYPSCPRVLAALESTLVEPRRRGVHPLAHRRVLLRHVLRLRRVALQVDEPRLLFVLRPERVAPVGVWSRRYESDMMKMVFKAELLRDGGQGAWDGCRPFGYANASILLA